MEVLAGGVGTGPGTGTGGGGGGGRGGRGLPLPPPPGRRYLRQSRQSSLSLSPSDMFLFRPPNPTYVASSWPGDLCVLGSSVCLALERVGGASKVLLFCHGTSSDIGMSRRSLEILREGLGCHVIGVEYPGYGLTADGEPTEESINAAVRVAFLHLTEVMGWPADRVVVMGRSLGSGPAARLAREFQPGALFLLAPFTGVADIAGSIVGDTLASMFSLNQWDNKREVAATSSPTLVLHGLKDQVVPHTHSLDLYRASAASKKYVGLLLESDHNRISWNVVCDMYAKPFMEMVCPAQGNRALGIRQMDVEKLSNFDPSGKAGLILACAEAVWARRRQEHGGDDGGGGCGGGGGEGTAQAAAEAPATAPAGNQPAAGPATNTYTSEDRGWTPPNPNRTPSPSVPGDGYEHEQTSGAAAKVSPSASPRFSGLGLNLGVGTGEGPGPAVVGQEQDQDAGAENRIHGTSRRRTQIGMGTGWWSGTVESSSAGDNSGGGGGVGVGVGGWGSGTVRAPAFEGRAMGSIGSGGGGSPPGDVTSGDSKRGGGGVGGNGTAGGGAVKLGGAAEYAAVRGKNSGGGGGGGGGDETATAEGKKADAEGGWGKLSGLFSGR